LLLYVVYICQKSFNFIDAFNCYKQKCKLTLFNLAHPVDDENSAEHDCLPTVVAFGKEMTVAI